MRRILSVAACATLAISGLVVAASVSISGGWAWRTECDTALTGQSGCRSFAVAKVIEQTRSGYRFVTKEIFNNMVRFS